MREHIRKARFSVAIFLLLCIPACGQNASPSNTNQATTATEKKVTAYTLPPDKLKESEALYKLGQKFLIFGTLYSWLILLAVLYSGIAARYRDWAEAVSRWRFFQAIIFVFLLLITLAVADLPVRIYAQHIWRQYGLSVQSWQSWFADLGKGRIINIVILSFLLWLLQFNIRLSPRRWWFYFWLEILPLIVAVVFVWPLLVDPLFNKFEPLEATHPALVEAIEKVAQHGGLTIPRNRMFEMKASEKVTTLNAYVTGLGASKRVVVWDNTIEKATTPQTLAVFGHEMGHYVLHHVIKGLVLGCVGVLFALYIVFRLSSWLLPRFGPRWRIRALYDWAAVPMFFLLYALLSFFTEPAANGFSRYIEHQADVYGLEVIHGVVPDSQQVAAQSFQALGELDLDYPYPNRLEVFWSYTHPPTADRLRFALDYDPWGKGEKPEFVK